MTTHEDAEWIRDALDRAEDALAAILDLADRADEGGELTPELIRAQVPTSLLSRLETGATP